MEIKPVAYTTEQVKAAYALNLCTVSVSQIIEYNDEYILDQEYNAILNNLNLEQMPKDEALLSILTELLNTITFFRIQELKKEQIEKEYQKRMKDAIWSAIPNIGMIVAGGTPAAMIASLAIQVGTGYMNYRKTKASIGTDKDKQNLELELTAIDQFNALRRELFTTAWRLSERYNFPDELRLTENQIRQFNQILMDPDDLRKYERLEAIQDKFIAYLPFWYHFGHTAACIASSQGSDLKWFYIERAAQHFEQFYHLYNTNQLNLLREDHLLATYALEYADILMIVENINIGRDQKRKISDLLGMAHEHSGNSNDLLQLCAIGYLKINEYDKASRLFRILVNEEYNTQTNARILSRLYAVKSLQEPNNTEVEYHYKVLQTRINPAYLFPFPAISDVNNDSELQQLYLQRIKRITRSEYQLAFSEFIYQYMVRITRLLFPESIFGVHDDTYFNDSPECRVLRRNDFMTVLNGPKQDLFLTTLINTSLRSRYIDILNDMLLTLEKLTVFREHPQKRRMIARIRFRIVSDVRDSMNLAGQRLKDRKFNMEDYDRISDSKIFSAATDEFFDMLRNGMVEAIKQAKNLDEINRLESDYIDFCTAAQIEVSPYPVKTGLVSHATHDDYIDYSVMGESILDEEIWNTIFGEMLDVVNRYSSELLVEDGDTRLLRTGTDSFDRYFKNSSLSQECGALVMNTVAIIDDTSKTDKDLLLTTEGIRVIEKNTLHKRIYFYDDVTIRTHGNRTELLLDPSFPSRYAYTNSCLDLEHLYSLIKELSHIASSTGRYQVLKGSFVKPWW